ncbi:MAG: ABC transporter permease [Chloroflexi bacterium]|nr:ABC transporter permease [Chloroflexota bacterium]
MTLNLIFKRMRREWRVLSILLLAVCLVTGFFALGPLYIRAVTEVDIRSALKNADPEALKVTVVSETPVDQNAENIIKDELGPLAVGVDRFIRAQYTAPEAPSGQGDAGSPGIAVCGFILVLGADPNRGLPAANECYQPFAFERLDQLVDVVAGRLPQRLATPDMVNPAGLSEEQQAAQQIGIYNRGETEAVVTQEVADQGKLELGSRFYLGRIFADGTATVASVVIVGIVEPKNTNDPIWSGNQMFLTGADIEVNNTTNRYDWGMAFDPAAYQDWIAPVVPGSSYIWRIHTDPDVINSNNAQDYSDALTALQNRLGTALNGAQTFSGLAPLISGYGDRVKEAEGPIILLSGAVLFMMLYHLVTTVNLILQQQGTEWSSISSRGGSTFQLFKLQFITVLLLGFLGLVVGPLLSRVFLLFMERFGPLAQALDGASFGNVSIPVSSYFLSVGAGAACVAFLSLPAVPAAKKSLLRLKQATSRPPTRPFWTGFFLDFWMILGGIVLVVRMYYIADGRIKDLYRYLINPAKMVQFVADHPSETGGLKDPGNLASMALLITGIALFWLRIFPILMGLASRLISRRKALTGPLAVWNIERNPGHYAQLILLLIGTLALGTASLGLTATREAGGWRQAQLETGGAARVEINPTLGDASDIAWDRLDGVANHASILRVSGTALGRENFVIIGINPDEFAEAFPDYADDVAALKGTPDLTQPGIVLPDDATQLTVQVWSQSLAADDVPEPSVVINAYVVDAIGTPYLVQLSRDAGSNVTGPTGQIGGPDTGPAPTPAEQWVTLSGYLPVSGRLPYRMWRFGMATTQGNLDSFSHKVYLDYWQTVDANGIATPLESYETQPAGWQPATLISPFTGSWVSLDIAQRQISGAQIQYVQDEVDPVAENDHTALKIDYNVRRVSGRSTEPSVMIDTLPIDRIPAIISGKFADVFRGTGQGAANRGIPPLELGSERDLNVDVGPGTVPFGFRVVGVTNEGFPTIARTVRKEGTIESAFIIVPLEVTRALMNQQTGGAASFFDTNQVWLDLPEREPTDKLKQEIAQVPGVTVTHFAWDRFGQIQREPLPSAVAGLLYIGFIVSLILSLLDFAFYIIVTAKQRSFTFGVLRSLGWDTNNVWRLLLFENLALVVPALVIGTLLGAGLAYLLLPFLVLTGNETLRFKPLEIVLMLASLVGGFAVLLTLTATWLRSMSVNQVLRLGEE